MTLTGTIVLLLLGLLFIMLEILVLPGTTVLGIAGVVLMLLGLWFTFVEYGNATGFYVLGITATVTLAAVVFAFRAGTWDRFTVHQTISGQVNTIDETILNIGDDGISLSRLAPMGNAEINGKQYEVTTNGEFVNPATKITIVALTKNQIKVKPKNV